MQKPDDRIQKKLPAMAKNSAIGTISLPYQVSQMPLMVAAYLLDGSSVFGIIPQQEPHNKAPDTKGEFSGHREE